jgi:hypothetical protein
MNNPLTGTPISPLRQRLIDDMNMRRFSRETQRNYIRDVGRFATFLGPSCRRHVAPANDTSRAHRRAGIVTCADPCRHRRKRPPALPDIGRDR